MSPYELLRQGGTWLAAARSWLQSNTINGDRVTWGSGDILTPPLTVQQVEELAAHAVAAVVVEREELRHQLEVERNQRELLKASLSAAEHHVAERNAVIRATGAEKDELRAKADACEARRNAAEHSLRRFHDTKRVDKMRWAAEIDRLREALEESVKLQSHYATLLNGYDGGERRPFGSAHEWMDRLRSLAAKPSGPLPVTPGIHTEWCRDPGCAGCEELEAGHG